MRRIAFIVSLLAVVSAGLVVAGAGADDSHTYKIELDNAFGLVHDSEVRIAGVTSGTVESLDVDAAKKALVTIKVSGPLSQFRVDATCSSQPQSLIAEYFLDCQPGNSKKLLADDGLVPVTQTRTTVQNDLVQATLREPFKARLALIINEFGTALAGNPDNLNAAIRRGAPALQSLRQALAILARQNTIIRDLNVNSDEIIGRLTERRQDVVRFVQNANRTAVASAERRADLEANFKLLPGFLTELRPTLARLGDLSQQSTPLLTELNGASGQLNRLTRTLPPFNDAATPSVETLGDAADVGRQALREGQDEIKALNDASVNAYAAANPIANILVDLDDPNRAVETDARAVNDTGRPAPTGYTGFEGLLNYVYYQALAVNQFDEIGHLLHFIVFEFHGDRCGHFNAGFNPDVSDGPTTQPMVPKDGGGFTTSAAERARCVSWLGPNQPGINSGPSLPPFHDAVCPGTSNDPSLCSAGLNPRQTGNVRSAGSPGTGGPQLATPQTPVQPGGGAGGGLPQTPKLPNLPNGPKLPHVPKVPHLPNVPNVPNVPGLPNLPGGLGGLLGPGGGQNKTGPLGGGAAPTNDLLNFLFGA
jgi:ABC-type transporter Mla subunit MlaD